MSQKKNLDKPLDPTKVHFRVTVEAITPEGAEAMDNMNEAFEVQGLDLYCTVPDGITHLMVGRSSVTALVKAFLTDDDNYNCARAMIQIPKPLWDILL